MFFERLPARCLLGYPRTQAPPLVVHVEEPEVRGYNGQGGVTPIDSIVTAATALSQWSTVTCLDRVNGQSGVKKTVNIQIPVQNAPRLQCIMQTPLVPSKVS